MKNVLNMNAQGGRGTISLNPINPNSNENGAIVTGGSILSLSECNQFYGGVLSASDQTIPGSKTFADTANFDTSINLASDAYITQNNQLLIHSTPYSNANFYAGNQCGNLSNSGFGNLGIGGFHSLQNVTSGQDNTCVGTRSGQFITSADRNTLIGFESGLHLSTENNNLFIDNKGVTGDNNCIKIGENAIHTSCYLQGITGATGTDEMVCVEPSTGKLGKRAILTVGAIGSTPNSSGATISSQVLTLQPASDSFAGVVTNGTQTIAGAKTLSDNLTCSKSIYLPTPAANGDGAIYTAGNRLIQEWNTSNLFVGRAGNLNTNTTCVGVGLNALANANGVYFSTAVGVDACAAATSGAHTLTALGRSALIANTTGIQNIAIGYNAASAITTTSGNIHIGNVGVLGDTAVIKIGTSQTSCAIAGISGRTSSSGIATYINASGVLGTTTSSARFKQDIKSVDKSFSDKIYQMEVVEFSYKDDKDHRKQFGMTAEQVNDIMPEIVVHEDDDPTKAVYAIQYHLLTPLIIKELQEQKKRIDQLETQIQSLLKGK